MRISLGFFFFIAYISAVLFITVWRVAEKQEEDLIDHIVAEAMDHFLLQYQANPDITPHRTANLHGYIVHNADELKQVPKYIRDLQPGLHEAFQGEREFHVVVSDLGDTRFYLAYDSTYHETRMQRFEWLIFASLVITAGVSLGLGFYFSGLLVKPVADLANRVDRLHLEHTQTPLAQRYRDHEVVRLATAFDNYISRLNDLIEREKSFTADVSHELRTPLTAIKTSCELLQQDKELAPTPKERINRIERGCERMTKMVETLLALARGVDPTKFEKAVLKDVVDLTLEMFVEPLAIKNIKIRIAVNPQEYIMTNANALSIVLFNLIKNAIEHTENGDITIQYSAPHLDIIDTGEGICAADIPYVFDRFYQGNSNNNKTTGFGLGLSIVKRFCDLYGWPVYIESTVGVETRVRLTLAVLTG